MFKLRLHQALILVCLCTLVPISLAAQSSTPAVTPSTGATAAVTAAPAAATPAAAPAPIVKGFNFALSNSSQHGSGAGWTNTLGPDLSYRQNRYLSGDFSFPYYTYLNTTVDHGSITVPYIAHNVIGDAASSIHLNLPSSPIGYGLTVAGGFPVGDTTYGLSADEYTYNVNNHFEHGFGPFTPSVDIGIGDSTNLTTHRVLRTELIVGTLANFTAGMSIGLPFNLSFSFDAYENMPLEDLNNYKKVLVGKRKIKKSVLGGSGPAEDNGLESELDIPLNPHFTLSGTYSRDLRAKEDTVGFSIAYVLRIPKKPAPVPKPAPVTPPAAAATH